jgi:glycogen debranching enzyme
MRRTVGLWLCLTLLVLSGVARAEENEPVVPRFRLKASGLELEGPTRRGRFFDVLGQRSAVFGREQGTFEAWVYPLKILDDFHLSFRLRDYPLDIEGTQIAASIRVRPEATIFTYSHAAFTVRQILYAPVDEAGIVMLLDVDSVLPLTITGSFRPRLRLMWPAGLMTQNLEWDAKEHVYYLTEETRRFAGVVGSPGARDLSVMPYQEEPRDVPIRFVIESLPEAMRSAYVPIVMTGAVEGKDQAKAAYDRLLASASLLYARNVAHYEALRERTVQVTTPDPRLDESFAWAKIGIAKGMTTNPLLGTGLVAGFRTSGESERPGFGWFFGRDALWTVLAIDSFGDFAAARTALDFLGKHQRADGKIPHEVSQSATLIPWFADYEYAWKSADATPLYVAAQADHWRASGDAAYLKSAWDSILRAYRFTAATDADGNGLVENTKVGHGWVEGGALYPAHEEIYLQGVWIEAAKSLAEMAEALNESALAGEARAAAERTRLAVERIFWRSDRGFYGFATTLAPERPPQAEPGPNRERRQARLDELAQVRLVDEDTVLPAVPLWWGQLEDERAQSQIDHLGSGALATDWGARILSDQSRLYDPLSYHYGSVWPLFTGWAAMGAYRYGRPHVGYQALMANALLRSRSALGFVTELLSGDFNAPFGRSSDHQVWSEAMVAAPLLRGLLGIEAISGGRTLRFAPALPADWDRVAVRNVALGAARYDLSLVRSPGRTTISVARRGGGPLARLVVAPAFPLDARLRSVRVDGRELSFQASRVGDVQRAEVTKDGLSARTELVFVYNEGTDVYARAEASQPGARSGGLRILRSRAEARALHLVLEGRAGRSYALRVRTPGGIADAPGLTAKKVDERDWELKVPFEGTGEGYVRRELSLPLH